MAGRRIRCMPRFRAVSLLAIASVLVLSWPVRADDPPATTTAAEAPALRVVVFAMGQADSMLIVGPSKSVLVDCGAPIEGSKKGFEHVKTKIEELCGRPHVDDVIVTHFHSDHTGDSPDAEHAASGFWGLFAAGVTVTSILDHGDHYPEFGEESHPHKAWVESLNGEWKEKKVYHDRHTPAVGDVITLGGDAKIRIVAVNGNGVLEKEAKSKKSPFEGGGTPNENDYSIAFVLSCGNWEMYSGGDLSGTDYRAHTGGARTKRHDVYSDIETTIKEKVGNVEVLRVDHHGSNHSTNDAFVQALRPEVSLISCGVGNTYKHPAKEVVARLQAFGPVFVTSGLARDWEGDGTAPKVEGDMTITVSGDGASYAIAGKDGEIFKGKSFSAEEKKKGLDHPETKTKP
jgi:hypothetical protein